MQVQVLSALQPQNVNGRPHAKEQNPFRNAEAGKEVSATVITVRPGSIRFMTAEGVVFSARRQGGEILRPGDQITMQITGGDEQQTSLKMTSLNGQSVTPDAASTSERQLLGLGIAPTQANIEFATTLRELGLPVNQNAVARFEQLARQYPDLPVPQTAVFATSTLPIAKGVVQAFAQAMDTPQQSAAFLMELGLLGENTSAAAASAAQPTAGTPADAAQMQAQPAASQAQPAAPQAQAAQTAAPLAPIAEQALPAQAAPQMPASAQPAPQMQPPLPTATALPDAAAPQPQQAATPAAPLAAEVSAQPVPSQQPAVQPDAATLNAARETVAQQPAPSTPQASAQPAAQMPQSTQAPSAAPQNPAQPMQPAAQAAPQTPQAPATAQPAAQQPGQAATQATPQTSAQTVAGQTASLPQSAPRRAYLAQLTPEAPSGTAVQQAAKELPQQLARLLTASLAAMESARGEAASHAGNSVVRQTETLLNQIQIGAQTNPIAYMQVPVELRGQTHTGELYILKREERGGKSAPLDAGNATVAICLETNHMKRVEAILTAKQYNLNITFKAETALGETMLTKQLPALQQMAFPEGYTLGDIAVERIAEKLTPLSAAKQLKGAPMGGAALGGLDITV